MRAHALMGHERSFFGPAPENLGSLGALPRHAQEGIFAKMRVTGRGFEPSNGWPHRGEPGGNAHTSVHRADRRQFPRQALHVALLVLPACGLIGFVLVVMPTERPIFPIESVLTFGSIFVGSLAAGVAGFAFSAITGALLLHWLAPATAVPLLLTCSLTTQLVSITALWKTMQWRDCFMLLAGGIPAIPIGAYLLRRLDPGTFAFAFGALLVGYAGYTLFRPGFALRGSGRVTIVAVGFAGGITGGAVAFPGAIPAIW